MEKMRDKIIIDSMRLVTFLGSNQLVQAHAVAQRLEGIFEDVFRAEVKEDKIENHRYWKAYKSALRSKNLILSGKQKEALEAAEALNGQV